MSILVTDLHSIYLQSSDCDYVSVLDPMTFLHILLNTYAWTFTFHPHPPTPTPTPPPSHPPPLPPSTHTQTHAQNSRTHLLTLKSMSGMFNITRGMACPVSRWYKAWFHKARFEWQIYYIKGGGDKAEIADSPTVNTLISTDTELRQGNQFDFVSDFRQGPDIRLVPGPFLNKWFVSQIIHCVGALDTITKYDTFCNTTKQLSLY